MNALRLPTGNSKSGFGLIPPLSVMPVAWQARRARMARFDSAEGRAKAAAARTPAPRLALAGMRRTGFRAHAKTVGRIMHMLASKKHKILVVARKFRRTGMAPAHTMVFLIPAT